MARHVGQVSGLGPSCWPGKGPWAVMLAREGALARHVGQGRGLGSSYWPGKGPWPVILAKEEALARLIGQVSASEQTCEADEDASARHNEGTLQLIL